MTDGRQTYVIGVGEVIGHEQGLMFTQLTGATEGLIIDDPAVRLWMVTRLMTCQAHQGVHHFAVTGDGKTLWMSKDGVACLGIDEREDARVKLIEPEPDA